MDNQDLAYIAGFFDGEGCIRIAKSIQYGKKIRPAPSYTLQCKVTNTNLLVLEYMQDLFGGSIYLNNKNRKENHKPCYCWYMYNDVAMDFLVQVKDFLKLKFTEAEYAIAFQRFNSQYHNNRTRRPSGELATMDEVYKILKAAKTGGQ